MRKIRSAGYTFGFNCLDAIFKGIGYNIPHPVLSIFVLVFATINAFFWLLIRISSFRADQRYYKKRVAELVLSKGVDGRRHSTTGSISSGQETPNLLDTRMPPASTARTSAREESFPLPDRQDMEVDIGLVHLNKHTSSNAYESVDKIF